MSTLIRNMTENDRKEVLKMMSTFYNSSAVISNGSEDIFNRDIDNCIGDCSYLEGYIFQDEEKIQGYAMVAKSFSTEFGSLCNWIEDLYLKREYRDQGIGSKFLGFIQNKYPDRILRLEVEDENKMAVHVYKKHGYEALPYQEMICLRKN